MKNVLYIASFENERFKGGIYTIAKKIIENAFIFSSNELKLDFLSSCQIKRSINAAGKLRIENIQNLLVLRTKIREILTAGNVEVVYINTSNALAFMKDALLCNWIAKMSDVKIILHIHYSSIHKILPSNLLLKSLTLKWLRKSVDHLVLLDHSTLSDFREVYGGQISYLPNFFSENYLADRSSTKLRILYLGTIDKRKGFDRCLDAVSILEQNNVDFEFNVAGLWTDEAFKSQMQKRLRNSSLSEKINFRGFVNGENKKTLMENSDCLLLLSQAEGMSMSLLECMNAGIAAICSDIDTHKELMSSQSDLETFSLKKIDSIADKLMAYSSSREKIIEDGEKCRKIASQYSLDNHLQRCIAIIKKT